MFCRSTIPGIVAASIVVAAVNARGALPWLQGRNESALSDRLVFRAWRTETGLPHNTINAILQAREGYLWVGTRDGLARFDGVQFTTFGLDDGLPSVEVQTLYEDREGTLWIGTSGGGLSRWNRGRIETLSFPQYLEASGTVTSLAEDGDGRLWIGTRAGLIISEHGRYSASGGLERLTHSGIRALLYDRGGGMWIATLSDGLFEFRDQRLGECTGPPGNERILAYCLLEDRRGRLWASIGNGTVLCREEGQWRPYAETNGLPFAYVTCLAEDGAGTIWAGSLDDGLYCLQGGRFEGIKQEQGLSANDVRALCPDREGNLWVGTRTGGLNRLGRSKVLTVGIKQGLTNDYTRSVAETADGVLWVGTTGGGLYRLGTNGFTPVLPFFSSAESVLATRDGSLWWGAARGLLCLRNEQLAASYTNEPWLGPAAVTALAEDNRGRLWAGTSEGRLVCLDQGSFHETTHEVARGPITGLAPEPGGGLWVGSMAGGLRHISAGEDRAEAVTEGLLSQAVRTLYLDREGALWIGSAGGGLSCLIGGRLTKFTSAAGLNARTVVQIVEDDFGYLWLGTTHGVLRVRKSELKEVAEGKRVFMHPRSFGINEGMPAEECSSGFCPAGLKTRAGLVCISTVKGLVFFDPSKEEKELPAPKVILEEVLVNGNAHALETVAADSEGQVPREGIGASLELSSSGPELEFRYTGISFSAPGKLRFRYQLKGLDRNWVEAGERRTAHYYRVPPGNYEFRVLACNADGVWSSQPSGVALVVPPHLWETYWFIVLVTFGALGLMAGSIRLVERRRYRRRLALIETRHAVERERLRISRDMHDDIGGVLTQVSQLSDLGQSEAVGPSVTKAYFERIGAQARVAVRALDEIVWATNPKNDNLPSFAEYLCQFADEMFENSAVRCWLEVPTALPKVPLSADIRHNVFLASKEAFNNVLKHARATQVWLRLKVENGAVCVSVEDDGVGFEAEKPKKEGNGLGNMQARLVSCGGRMELHSEPGKGTKVLFHFSVPPET